MTVQILQGDCRELLPTLPDESVHSCVTSPPYFGLRSYNGGDAEIGQEETPHEYVETMVEVFREVRRVLRNDGTLWIVIGDSYAGAGYSNHAITGGAQRSDGGKQRHTTRTGLKPKDLMGIPWRTAFALQEDGWYLRSDIIWCLSGGTWVYAKTQKGEMPMQIRDAARLNPATVKLWNGEKWTQVLGWSTTTRTTDEVEIVLRSGERISCTSTHRFPTSRGLLAADEIRVGDSLTRVPLPEPDHVKDSEHIGVQAAWLAGLYLAEGSRSGSAIQIAGHVREHERWDRVQRIVSSYGGTVTRTISGNKMDIRIYGRVVRSVIDHLIGGKTAKDKALKPVAWRYSNDFLRSLLDGYLSGDGHWDPGNKRWRLGFTRNYSLERDLRVMAARLGIHLVLNLSHSTTGGKSFPSFRGELRFERSGHWNEHSPNEIVDIRKGRCRQVYDVGVEDEPHVFALASGVLTHNSKPNPMPESVQDRPTRAHEYIFLLAKSERYWYDADAIREPNSSPAQLEHNQRYAKPCAAFDERAGSTGKPGSVNNVGIHARPGNEGRNCRSVWTIATQPFSADALPGGMTRRASADCPTHGLRAFPETWRKAAHDGPQGVGRFRIDDNDARRALVPPSVSSSNSCHTQSSPATEHVQTTQSNAESKTSTPLSPGGNPSGDGDGPDHTRRIQSTHGHLADSSDYVDQSCSPTAIGHSKQNSKTALDPETNQPCTPFVETSAHIDDRLASLGLFAPDLGMSVSSTLEDSDAHGPATNDAQKATGIGDKCTCPPILQDHFATFPEKLIEPCILAGCPRGGTVLDPFAGSGTTLRVATKHGRHGLGIELNPDYCALIEKRLAAVPVTLPFDGEEAS